MSGNSDARSKPAPQGSRTARAWYLAAVCLLPAIVLWRQDNILFPSYGSIDSWTYFGYFRNLVEFKRGLLFGNTFGTHWSLILPGAALHGLFGPLAAEWLLHLGAHTLASVSLFLTLLWVVGARRAFAAAMLFSLNPWVNLATAADFVDGMGIAYCLLAMALLTWAALAPVRRLALVGAGMALAALVYCDPEWMMLAPLLPLYYLGLARAWHGDSPARSLAALCRWFGAGCAIVTAAFAAINYRLDGHAFFYASPILAVLHRAAPRAAWWQGLWRDGAPSIWLAFPMAAALASVAVLIRERRRAHQAMTGAALFSWLFLGALAWMTGCQMRGIPMLASAYPASILLPFGFLAMGAGFWEYLETARPRHYILFCCALALALGYAWSGEGPVVTSGLAYPVWTGVAALAASLLWRRTPESALCGLAGFFVLTALGVAPCYGGLEAHGYRDQYVALCRARQRIETVRQGGPVRFWFDKQDRAASDAVALTSTYSWESRLSDSFYPAPCGETVAPGTLIAMIATDRWPSADAAAMALTGCWIGKRLGVEAVETDTIPRGASSYRLSLLRVESQ